MEKVAVFGKPGSGKSTFSKALAANSKLPLYQLDNMVYQADGSRIPAPQFAQQHQAVLAQPHWIIDGLGPLSAFSQRLAAADTLIYIDLPYPLSYWLVTKRCLAAWRVKPEGWPEGCSVIKGTWQSYRMLRLSPRFWNHEFEQQLQAQAAGKQLHIVRSLKQLRQLVQQLSAN